METRLSKHIHCINEKIFVKTQENSWVDKDIFKFWLHNIWFKYNKLHSKKKSLLILDRATSHYYENISDDFKRNEGNYILIPPGLTRFLQPLDISINFPFKNALKKIYINFNLFKMNSEKAKPEDIINFIYEIWYDNNEIKPETIIKSFKSLE